MADTISDVAGSTAAKTGTAPAPSEFQPERTGAFDDVVEDLRKLYVMGPEMVQRSLSDRIRRRLGIASMSGGAAALYGLTGLILRLALVVLATALAGQWTGLPWGRWAVILVLYILVDVAMAVVWPDFDSPIPSWMRPGIEEWTALLPTIARESDLRDLAGFTRRFYRLPVVATAGVAVAAVMLLTGWVFAPTALRDLPAGSIVLLALLLYDFGTLPIWSNTVLNWATVARQARYDHHLFWASPADSPEIHKATRRAIGQASTASIWITFFLVLTVVLVGWDSSLVLPLAVGFVVIGYLATLLLTLRYPASVRKIVERSRQLRLQGLQRPNRRLRTALHQPFNAGVGGAPGSPLSPRQNSRCPRRTDHHPHHAPNRGRIADPHHCVRHHGVWRGVRRTHPRLHPALRHAADSLDGYRCDSEASVLSGTVRARQQPSWPAGQATRERGRSRTRFSTLKRVQHGHPGFPPA